MHYLLCYQLASDYLERRAEFRDEHLKLAWDAQERGEMFIGPGIPVYQGMVVGQASRERDVELNISKQKKLTNVRSKGEETTDALTPPRELTLELALEYIGPDELLEVTPQSLRIRKRIADAKLRLRAQREGANPE